MCWSWSVMAADAVTRWGLAIKRACTLSEAGPPLLGLDMRNNIACR